MVSYYSQREKMHTQQKSKLAWIQFLTRLHFYIGLFIGPFIFIAAITGTLYVITPQIENHLYHTTLFTSATGSPHPLSAQIDAARQHISTDYQLSAIRPAAGSNMTSRVMFSHPSLGESESRAIFIDPVSLAMTGDMIVYGTSGVLPFRTTLDYLHRNLLLGTLGRNYSETAASWLWVATLLGIALWWIKKNKVTAQQRQQSKHLQLRHWHSTLGVIIAIGLLFLSATGLTWSRWAGDNIGTIRSALNWVTPSVKTQLSPAKTAEAAPHHEGMLMPHSTALTIPSSDFDHIQHIAQEAGLVSNAIEIVPPASANRAWVVREIHRNWPTQVDSIAIHPQTMQIISRANFADYPVIAKLIRWGVDLHMGVLFGVLNQIVMAIFGIALSVLIVLGYMMWWKKRPAASHLPLTEAWLQLPLYGKSILIIVALLLGTFLPMIGITLCVFILIDLLRTQWHENHR